MKSALLPPVRADTALFLDIDGTLLDLARTPDAVVVPATLSGVLAQLRAELGGALAFVSGRSLAAIDALFAPFRTAAVGCHGAEIRRPDGSVHAAPPISDTVREFFVRLSRGNEGLVLEDKKYALALHYRDAPEAEASLRAALAEHRSLIADAHVSILYGKFVIDAKPQGIDKGTGVSALLREAPFAGRAVLFGGDDTTDMDVFRILTSLGGQGFSVGREFSGAGYMFESPGEVRRWLTQIAAKGVAR